MANHTIAHDVYVPFLEKKGFLSWILTTDHKRIGILYLVSTSLFFLVAGIIALLMRFELLTPAPTLSIRIHTTYSSRCTAR